MTTMCWSSKVQAELFNPTLELGVHRQAISRDPVAGRAERLAERRDDLSGFLASEWVERAAVLDTGELMPPPGCVPFADSRPKRRV